MLHTPIQQGSFAILLLICGLALWRGGWPERIGAAAMFGAWMITPLFLDAHQRSGPQYGVLAVDLVLLVILLTLALTSDRWWPLWAVGFHALGSLTHLAVAIDHQVMPWAYITGNVIFSFLTLAALLVGSLVRRTAVAPG